MRTVGASISGSFRNNKYSDLEEDRTDQTWDLGFSITYKPTSVKWLNCRLGYTYRELDSDDEESNYQEDRIIFTINMVPNKTYRF